MSVRLSLCLLLPLAAACSSDSPSEPADAAVNIDASQATVTTVTCPSGTLPTVTADNSASKFEPMSVTVAVGGVVSFTMPGTHNVVPNVGTSAMTDPGLTVGFGQTKCLKFAAAGTFSFKCAPHGFVGTVVVQ